MTHLPLLKCVNAFVLFDLTHILGMLRSFCTKQLVGGGAASCGKHRQWERPWDACAIGHGEFVGSHLAGVIDTGTGYSDTKQAVGVLLMCAMICGVCV